GKVLSGKPLVSIVIPTRNHLEKLKKALESVARQTYNNYETIVVDDASTDQTYNWVRTSYPNINSIRLTKQGGAAKARNRGIKMSKGKFIAFLDSDDEWLAEYLQIQVEALVQNPEVNISFSEVTVADSNGLEKTIRYVKKENYPSLIHRLLLETSFIFSMSSAVIKADALNKIGLLNERLKITHDRELYIRLLQLGGNIIYIPKTMVIKHSHESNISLNFPNWAKDAMLLLDIFFADKKNKQEYKETEGNARREIILALFLYLSNKNQRFFSKLRVLPLFLIDILRFGKYLRKDIGKLFIKKN
ncbi:MAG: glycosyltransferase, partial [Candidatus Omnitrophica bacterium]|nr:glycosyltransferase [Candidatus Omnitrophota bacterium]